MSIVPFGVTYEKIGTIQRRLAWPLHKDDTLSRSGRPTGLNIYFLGVAAGASRQYYAQPPRIRVQELEESSHSAFAMSALTLPPAHSPLLPILVILPSVDEL